MKATNRRHIYPGFFVVCAIAIVMMVGMLMRELDGRQTQPSEDFQPAQTQPAQPSLQPVRQTPSPQASQYTQPILHGELMVEVTKKPISGSVWINGQLWWSDIHEFD